jgi:hypothetical protein
VQGSIRSKYLSLGAEASLLGYPMPDETKLTGGTVTVQYS